MERSTSIEKASEIMGKNFLGPIELLKCEPLKLNVHEECFNERIPFGASVLEKFALTHYLIFAVPFHQDGSAVTILSLRSIFGTNPQIMEPCFYNQDWFLNEPFVKRQLDKGWYLISKNIVPESKGKLPDSNDLKLISAVLATYTFFAAYLIRNEVYLKNDYTWNNDCDSNGDIIYVGKYIDPLGINKNGWEIHRHLSVKQNYGISTSI